MWRKSRNFTRSKRFFFKKRYGFQTRTLQYAHPPQRRPSSRSWPGASACMSADRPFTAIPHLGHARPAVTFDLLFRYLKASGYKVRYVRNVTDVGHLEHDADEGEDKIAKKARLEQLEPMEVAHYYTERYHRAMDALNVETPSIEPLRLGPYHRADRADPAHSRRRVRLRLERVGLFRRREVQREIPLRPPLGPQSGGYRG